ncbi:MAG TPA: IS4 family transposase [Polyangiaceae bacterium]
MAALGLGPVRNEFEGAELGDERLGSRLVRIAQALESDPAGGFPRAMRSDAELEGLYRFINNQRFSADDIIAPHQERTFERAREAGEVLAIHDSSYFMSAKQAPRREVGITSVVGARGFIAHVSLVATLEGTPLGLGYIETLVRTGTKMRKPKRREQKVTTRWLRSVEAIDAEVKATHVIDAEGDFFELLEAIQKAGARFVIRAGHLSRVVECNGIRGNLAAVVAGIKPRVFRKIELGERRYVESLRGPHSRTKHPRRDARTASVAISSGQLQLRAPRSLGTSDELLVNVVRVWEPNPPRGQPPVEWVLLTNEDISSTDGLKRVVDIYRKRWLTEEYFKALKTGCSLEKRQVASFDALRKVLALLAPIAYRLLLLRALHRQAANAPASAGFSKVDLDLIAGAQLPPTSRPKTLEQAYLLLARLGGHIKNNGPPGWLTLAAGYEVLLILRLGWFLGREFA